MTRRAVWVVGLGQCVGWGVLYYAFSVLIVPVERDLGVARWVVVGAFSLALLVSAVAAPHVGKQVDRGHGPSVVQAGGLAAAGLLALWALVPNVYLSYLIWPAVGLCMSAVLYEPVFAMVGKAVDDAGDRLRAIATITIFGGFASTVFLPLTGALAERWGWQHAVLILAAGLAFTTVVVDRYGLGVAAPRQAVPPRQAVSPRQAAPPRQELSSRLGVLVAVFTGSSFVSAALATNLVPALIERGLSPTTAAAFGGLFGVMQLPGRFLFVHHNRSVNPMMVLAGSLGLQITGLLSLTASRSFTAIAAGVALFACGSGLATLARPYLVLVFYGSGRAGEMNGVFARPQQLARAAGPVCAAALAGGTGYGVVFGVLAVGLSFVAVSLMTSRPSA